MARRQATLDALFGGQPEAKRVKTEAPAEKKSELPPKVSDGVPIAYAVLVDTFTRVEATTKRLEILELVTNLFMRIVYESSEGKPLVSARDNLLHAVYSVSYTHLTLPTSDLV